MTAAIFALAGDSSRRTGAAIYAARVLAARPELELLQLPGGFPDATTAEMDAVAAAFASLPDRPVIVDGQVYGALRTGDLAQAAGPLVALIHHPLAQEGGLSLERARDLHQQEAANLAIAAHVLVPSAHVARILTADYGVEPERITLAPPGFDTPPPHALPKEDPPLILAAGQIAARKGHDVLLAALARIRNLPWRAEIAGPVAEPETAAALHAQRDLLGLSDRVAFRGALDAAAMDAAYARASLFALASRYEGYGMVFAEALLRGLPVVACRTSAVPEVVPDGAGILVGLDDAVGLAAALERLLTDPALRAAMAVRAAAVPRPGWNGTAAVIAGVLDRLPRL